jgi:DNA-directed RNA polymerase subunit RPC12/RpoP
MTVFSWMGCNKCGSQVHLEYVAGLWAFHLIRCTSCGGYIITGPTREAAEGYIAGAMRQAELRYRSDNG